MSTPTQPPLNRLADLKDRINEWCAAQFPEQTAETIVRHMVEEAWELVEREVPTEAADTLILALAWAAHTKTPLLERLAIDNIAQEAATWAEEARDWASSGSTIAHAMTQSLIALFAWCYLTGTDLLAEAEAKHAVNLTRSWRRDADGIHRHVEVQP